MTRLQLLQYMPSYLYFIFSERTMIKNIQLLSLFKKAHKVSTNKGIHTDIILSARSRRNAVRATPYEPGIRHREFLTKDEDLLDEFDDFKLDERLDKLHAGRTFKENYEDAKRRKSRIDKIIVSKKFFSPRPQPHTLTYNERLCIKYLHKEDPVQWDLKTLSEGFPATPEIIKKVLKSEVKYTPEQAKALDLKVQKNWELLEEGKLDADPDLLEHLKKFINRRHVLLEQLNNEKFYLPEVKKEPVWNQGEMSSILLKYEKALEKLAIQSQQEVLGDEEFAKNELKKEKTSSLDLVHKKIEESVTSKEIESKDSFKLGEMINTYSNNVTFEELQRKILKRAEKKKRLSLMEKAILEDKLNTKREEYDSVKEESKVFNAEIPKQSLKKKSDTDFKVNSFESEIKYEHEETPILLPDQRTKFTSEIGIGKLLKKTHEKPLPENDSNIKKEAKKAINFSDPERLKREALYYDKEVSEIQHTSFWADGRSNNEKIMAELEKTKQEKPSDIGEIYNAPKSHVLSLEPYPERIKIPKKMQGSGMTFKVKDCYYDDDGEFLYRVPGMYK